MDERNKLEWLRAPLEFGVSISKFITSWYVAPIWIIGLGIFLGQPWWLCLLLAVVFGTLGSKLWN